MKYIIIISKDGGESWKPITTDRTELYATEGDANLRIAQLRQARTELNTDPVYSTETTTIKFQNGEVYERKTNVRHVAHCEYLFDKQEVHENGDKTIHEMRKEGSI